MTRRALTEWARCVTGQAWKEAYVFFKHDEGRWIGPAGGRNVCRGLRQLAFRHALRCNDGSAICVDFSE